MGELRNSLPEGFEPHSISWPLSQTAIVQDGSGRAMISHSAGFPVPEPDMVIVKTVAISINPCDWKMPSKFATPGARIGCDFSGYVVAIGPKVSRPHSKLRIGDRVCGGVHGSNPAEPASGAFAQYVNAFGDLLFVLPDDMSWEAGAVLGASVISTLSIVLYRTFNLQGTLKTPLDGSVSPFVLVYGASTSTGTMAVQLLKLSGYRPIATCSPKNFELVRSFGAEAVFDYRSPSCAEDIRKHTSLSLRYVLDVITDARSQTICSTVFGRAGGLYTVLELPDPESLMAKKRTIQTQMVNGLAATGKEIALADGYERSADMSLRHRAAELFQDIQPLLDQKTLRTHPPRVLLGRFRAIMEGLKILSERGTSGEKLVCFVDETAEQEYAIRHADQVPAA